MRIEDSNLSSRTKNALLSGGIEMLRDAALSDLDRLMKLRNFGETSLFDLAMELLRNGYTPKWLSEANRHLCFESVEEMMESDSNHVIAGPYYMDERWMLLSAAALLDRDGLPWRVRRKRALLYLIRGDVTVFSESTSQTETETETLDV